MSYTIATQTLFLIFLCISSQDNITALWQAIQTNRQEIIQLDRKVTVECMGTLIHVDRLYGLSITAPEKRFHLQNLSV